MTYGDIKFRLTKAFPGVDLDLIEGWINDRYAEILGELPWQRQNVKSVLVTLASYTTGAVALTQGSTAVTGVGTSWTSAMNGRALRTPPRREFYQFTYVSSTSGVLDRPYEGTPITPPTLAGNIGPSDLTALLSTTEGLSIGEYLLTDSEAVQISSISGNSVGITRSALGTSAASHTSGATVTPLIPYTIFQHIYPLPSDCRLLEDEAFSGKFGPMKRTTGAQLNESDPWRETTGVPQQWASYMDDNSTPPLMQVELWPVPEKAVGIPFTYATQDGPLTSTSTLLKVWLQPAALIEGVTARIKAHLKDYTGAQLHQAASGIALKLMRSTEAQGLAPTQMKLSSHYTQARRRRGRC
jgi:hypothetical protein